jgi:hypothetical protein
MVTHWNQHIFDILAIHGSIGIMLNMVQVDLRDMKALATTCKAKSR